MPIETGGERDSRHPTLENEELHFRYDRSRRLSRAPAEARWLEARRDGCKPGLLSALFATRASRMLFAVIVGIALVFFAAPFFERDGGAEVSLGASRWTLDAQYFEGSVLFVLARKGANSPQGGTLTLAISFSGANPVRRDFALAGGEEEEFRFAIPAAGGKPATARMALEVGGESAALQAPVR